MPHPCESLHYAVANWLIKLQKVMYSSCLESHVFEAEGFVVLDSTSRSFQNITLKVGDELSLQISVTLVCSISDDRASELQVDYLCLYQSLNACKKVAVQICVTSTSVLDGMSGHLHNRPLYPGGKNFRCPFQSRLCGKGQSQWRTEGVLGG